MLATQNPTAVPVDVDPTPGDILRGAALYIERHSHHKGDLFAPTGTPFPPACVHGAIYIAITGHTTTDDMIPLAYMPSFHLLAEHLAILAVDEDGEPYLCSDDVDEHILWNLSCWNDNQDRTPAEVIEALRSAADEYNSETYAQSKLNNDRNPSCDGFALGKLHTSSPDSSKASQPIHEDYPHQPGTLYDCPACEANCFCDNGFICVHCSDTFGGTE